MTVPLPAVGGQVPLLGRPSVLGQVRCYASPMGAWDADPFGNDDAADWAAEFEALDRTAGLQVLEAVFAAANQADYVEAPDGSIAVAAAQVVAWLLVPDLAGASSYSATAVAWTQRCGGQPDHAMVDAARRTLQRVQSDESELAELWDETGDHAWRSELQRIDGLLRQDQS